MSEGRRYGGLAAAVGVVAFCVATLGVLGWRHRRLMADRVAALTQIASGVEMDVVPGSRLVLNAGISNRHAPFFGETQHEWFVGANSHALSADGRTKTAWVALICTHMPLSPSAPRILIVENGAPEDARYVEALEAQLRARGLRYGLIHGIEVNGNRTAIPPEGLRPIE
jgi:hypothetical protein